MWKCKHCTFDNSDSFKSCEICLKPKIFQPPKLQIEEKTETNGLVFNEDHFSHVDVIDLPESSILKEDLQTKSNGEKLLELSDTKDLSLKPADISCNKSNIETNMNSEDSSFKPSRKSLGDLGENRLQQIIWLRPDQMREGSEPWQMIRDDFQPSDVTQGNLGTCWLVSVLSIISQQKKLLERVVGKSGEGRGGRKGFYRLHFFINGKWTMVHVDQFFPCHVDRRQLMFSKAQRCQLFVPLIEKGLAKIFGSYEALEAGFAIEALSILTGMPCQSFKLSPDTDVDGVATRLESAHHAGYLLATSCGDGESVGLRPRHAYSVHDVQLVTTCHGNREWLLLLRNPWGVCSWSGDWSSCSVKWNDNPELKECLLRTIKRSDLFWINFDDLKKYFNRVHICKVDDWKTSHIDRMFLQSAMSNDVIAPASALLVLSESCEIEFSLFQNIHRKSNEIGDSGLVVFKLHKINNFYKIHKTVAASKRHVSRYSNCSCVLDAGYYLIIGLSFNHWCRKKSKVSSKPFTLTIHSRKPYVLQSYNFTNSLSEVISRLVLDYGSLVLVSHVSDDVTAEKLFVQSQDNHNNIGFFIYRLNLFGPPIVVAVNENFKEKMNIRNNFVTTSNQLRSTRNTFLTVDCLPPRHLQVIAVLSRLSKFGDVNMQMSTIVRPALKPAKWPRPTNLDCHPRLYKPIPL